MRYAIVIEEENGTFGAYVPDLPGCAAVAETEEEVRRLIEEAIGLHIQSLQQDGEPVPKPHSHVDYIEVGRAA